MGLCASQGRLLMLTARKSDLELQAQFISQRRIQLSQETLRFTEAYNAAISNRKVVVSDNRSDQMNWVDFASNPGLLLEAGYTLQDRDGNQIMADAGGIISGADNTGANTYYSGGQVQQMFQSGQWQVTGADGEPVHYGSDYGSVVREVLDETDDTVAQADYETNMARIQAADKMLELQLKNIETEHKAVETEYDSVKKVIQKNIEVSFKLFS